jgi:hypothetical protein
MLNVPTRILTYIKYLHQIMQLSSNLTNPLLKNKNENKITINNVCFLTSEVRTYPHACLFLQIVLAAGRQKKI